MTGGFELLSFDTLVKMKGSAAVTRGRPCGRHGVSEHTQSASNRAHQPLRQQCDHSQPNAGVVGI